MTGPLLGVGGSLRVAGPECSGHDIESRRLCHQRRWQTRHRCHATGLQPLGVLGRAGAGSALSKKSAPPRGQAPGSGHLSFEEGENTEPMVNHYRPFSGHALVVAGIAFACTGGCLAEQEESFESSEYRTEPQLIQGITVYSQASSTQSGNEADNMFDGDTSANSGARWSASGLQSGSKSAKFDLGQEYVITQVRLHPFKNRAYQYAVKISPTGSSPWSDIVDRRGNTEGGSVLIDDVPEVPTRYVELLIKGASGYGGNWASIREFELIGYPVGGDGDGADDAGDGADPTGPDPSLPPGDNFDLEFWKITFPNAEEEQQDWLTAGGERPGEFYTDPVTGGMVFSCPNAGETTSSSTKYSRTELREMLRGADDGISTQGINGNNWVTSTSSASNRSAAGGVDGTLNATLTVDHVSTTHDDGDEHMVGRVIVGQIHAPDDEPCKLYYRKLPGNTRGSVYFAYEPESGSDVIYPLIGSPDNDASDPEDGIALGEPWSYEIDVHGHQLTVTVTREDGSTVSDIMTMDSYYDDAYLYFKAGVYNQNDGGADGDYAQATFHALTHTHD